QSAEIALAVAGFVGALAIAAVVVIVASARTNGGYVRRVVEWASDDGYVDLVAGVAESFVADVQTVAADGPTFARVGATSVLIWTIDVCCALVVFTAFGIDLPLPALLATGFFAVSVGNLAKVLPLSPGGIGLYEGAFTLLVVVLTPVAAPAALAVALVDHAVKNAVTVVGGVVSMLTLNVSLTEAVDGAGTADAIETEAGTTD
ncbi:lysylphosphatidylglycerol synthase domain-containing protein, partial [Halarchaeum acidiphilum]